MLFLSFWTALQLSFVMKTTWHTSIKRWNCFNVPHFALKWCLITIILIYVSRESRGNPPCSTMLQQHLSQSSWMQPCFYNNCALSTCGSHFCFLLAFQFIFLNVSFNLVVNTWCLMINESKPAYLVLTTRLYRTTERWKNPIIKHN